MTSKTVSMLQTRQKVFRIVTDCPKMSTLEFRRIVDSLSARTCLLFLLKFPIFLLQIVFELPLLSCFFSPSASFFLCPISLVSTLTLTQSQNSSFSDRVAQFSLNPCIKLETVTPTHLFSLQNLNVQSNFALTDQRVAEISLQRI